MVVTSLCMGSRVTGLYVGESNVRRYFRQRVAEIELQIDHLRIQCGLGADFWHDHPEIHDPRLCLWLQSKQWTGKSRESFPLAMIRSGKNSFVLALLSARNEKMARPNKGDSHEDKQADA
ncbi:MAG: hypothetical protein ABSF23_18460 [Terracidiphilus sp.]|jgi:hypothetical protein